MNEPTRRLEPGWFKRWSVGALALSGRSFGVVTLFILVQWAVGTVLSHYAPRDGIGPALLSLWGWVCWCWAIRVFYKLDHCSANWSLKEVPLRPSINITLCLFLAAIGLIMGRLFPLSSSLLSPEVSTLLFNPDQMWLWALLAMFVFNTDLFTSVMWNLGFSHEKASAMSEVVVLQNPILIWTGMVMMTLFGLLFVPPPLKALLFWYMAGFLYVGYKELFMGAGLNEKQAKASKMVLAHTPSS